MIEEQRRELSTGSWPRLARSAGELGGWLNSGRRSEKARGTAGRREGLAGGAILGTDPLRALIAKESRRRGARDGLRGRRRPEEPADPCARADDGREAQSDSVGLDACSTCVATDGGHRCLVAEFRCRLIDVPCRDRLHGLSVVRVVADPDDVRRLLQIVASESSRGWRPSRCRQRCSLPNSRCHSTWYFRSRCHAISVGMPRQASHSNSTMIGVEATSRSVSVMSRSTIRPLRRPAVDQNGSTRALRACARRALAAASPATSASPRGILRARAGSLPGPRRRAPRSGLRGRRRVRDIPPAPRSQE